MKKMMTRMAVAFAAALSCVAVSAQETASAGQWRGEVGACVQDANKMKTVFAGLSAADQVAFVAAMNEAIAAMPGSAEVKAAKYLEANQTAVVNAKAGNRTAIIAEIFATVPAEQLGLLGEKFAADLLNRNANPARTFTDAEFTQLSEALVSAVSKRTAGSEDSAVRTSFAIVMMANASGGTPANLADTLAANNIADEAARETATKEWIPAALGKNGPKNYDAMLGVAQAGDEPDHDIAVQLTGAGQSADVMLSEIASEIGGKTAAGLSSSALISIHRIAGTGEAMTFGELDTGLDRVPRAVLENPDSKFYRPGGRGQSEPAGYGASLGQSL